MSLPLRILDLVQREAQSAAQWYEEQQSGLGHRFLQALGETLLSIEQQPKRYPHLETVSDDLPIRRAIL